MFVAEQRRSKSSSGVFCDHGMTFSFYGKPKASVLKLRVYRMMWRSTVSKHWDSHKCATSKLTRRDSRNRATSKGVTWAAITLRLRLAVIRIMLQSVVWVRPGSLRENSFQLQMNLAFLIHGKRDFAGLC